jgi:membrane fusion protein (multidrug efflux system)
MAEKKIMTSNDSPVSPQTIRKKWLVMAMGIFILLGLGYLVYWAIFLHHIESTDDAYVSGNLVQITPQVAGTIITITVDDTDFVKAGSTLVRLDPTDAQLAFERACAQLAQMVRQTRHLQISNAQLEASVALSASERDKAQADLMRRQLLLKTDSITKEELAHAKIAVKSAQAAYKVAREKLKGNQALLSSEKLAEQPAIVAAAAQVRETYLALKRTTIVSPVRGYLARRAGQIGQRVNIGQNLMAVVPLDQLWVDANFKEVQLTDIRIGQEATLTADIYGSKVVYHGKVAGLGIGTGSAFSLLPAQNATGNWIKVVQRVPVRITLDKAELEKHPLRVGLSMQVAVNTQDQSGPVLMMNERQTPAYSTHIFEESMKSADDIINRIINENGS